ncbi:hypothetical protein KC19_3G235600 [Ceratodon purpureus]|uniref:Zinc finger CHCC-type domain-containing protein n=1 Tax=Ceratodon purpureus TaxID=3225 RepID=A0A8T0IR00_CERPU|nr:hypothetical protein KC19_3G235500 [Ceratodon purpureus]KAG0584804.1 hypothetical protein KC19_3G235600 [Ceratodon purpureus]
MAGSLRSLARFANAVRHHAGPRAPLPPSSSSSHASRAQAGAAVALFSGAGALRFMSADHTAKWMQNTEKKSPMELIDEVPPIKVDARVVACEGGTDPALGHPIEYISLDGEGPHVCKYCGLRYFQGNAHGHH